MQVSCCSINKVTQSEQLPEDVKLIVISDNIKESLRKFIESDKAKNINLLLSFKDEVSGENCISIVDALHILYVAKSCIKSDDDLLICCDGGVSRSAACVAFIEIGMLGRAIEDSIFFDSSKSPNERVLATLLAASVIGEDPILNLKEIDVVADKLFSGFNENKRLFLAEHI